MREGGNRLQHQTTEIEMTLGKFLVRTDLDQTSVTVGFRQWFEWDVDTRQVVIAPGVIHFIQPDDTIIGLRVDQSSNRRGKSNLLKGQEHDRKREQLAIEAGLEVPTGEEQ